MFNFVRIYGVWKNNIKLKPNKLYAVARSYPIERVVSKATPYLKLTSDKLKRQASRRDNMKNTLNSLELVDDVLWLNYKGYEIRIEQSKFHNNNNLVITVHKDTQSDYTHRLEVENKDELAEVLSSINSHTKKITSEG